MCWFWWSEDCHSNLLMTSSISLKWQCHPTYNRLFWKFNISLIFCPFASEVLAWINFEPVLFFHVVKGDYGFFAVQKNFNNVIVTCQNLYGYTPHITIVRTTRMKKINKNVNVNARPRDDFSCELQLSRMKMEHSKKET